MLVLGLVEVPWWGILLTSLLTAIVVFYIYQTRNHKFFKKQGIPYLEPSLILGTMGIYAKGMTAGEEEKYMKHRKSGMLGEFMGDQPVLTVWDEKMVADILIKESANFMNHQRVPGSMENKMLFNLHDEHWKSVRNEMSPTFTTGKLKKMNVEINRCAKAFAEYLVEKAEIGDAIEIVEYTGCFTMDVISSTGFGMQVDSLRDKENVFLKNANNIFDIRTDNFGMRMFLFYFFPNVASFLRKLGFCFQMIPQEKVDFFTDVINQAMAVRKSDTDQSRSDFLQLMINAQRGENVQDQDEQTASQLKGLTRDEIVANGMAFFSGGFDATANTLAFLVYSLATNPDIQTRLIEEIDAVVKNTEFVPYSVLQDMPYLEKCINETLRLYPNAPQTNRVANEETTINGVYIQKGMQVNIPIYAMQRDPDRWPQPEKFDPERFSPENKGDRSPYHYMPFGAGPRMCIGMRLALQEMKMAVVHMLKRVTIETCDKTQMPLQFDRTAVLRPLNLWLKVEKR